MTRELSETMTQELNEFKAWMMKKKLLREKTADMYQKYVARIGKPIDLSDGDGRILQTLETAVTSPPVKHAFEAYLRFIKATRTNTVEDRKTIIFFISELEDMGRDVKGRGKLKPKDILSVEDIVIVYRTSKTMLGVDPMHPMMCPPLYETACRFSEFTQITHGMVNEERREIVLPKEITKTNKEREVDVDASWDIIVKRMDDVGKGGILFPVDYHKFYNFLRRVSRRTGISPLRPHLFRHSFATNMAFRIMQEGISKDDAMEEVRKYLGHTSTKTTEMYVHLAEKITEDESIVKKYGTGLVLG